MAGLIKNAAQAKEVVAKNTHVVFHGHPDVAGVQEARYGLNALKEWPEVMELALSLRHLVGYLRASEAFLKQIPPHLQPYPMIVQAEQRLQKFGEAIKP